MIVARDTSGVGMWFQSDIAGILDSIRRAAANRAYLRGYGGKHGSR
jgi:hypothetical protein